MTDLVATLLVQRQLAADDVFDVHDFGAPLAAVSGWEFTTPGDEMIRPVFLENEDPKADSVKVYFTVRFKPDSAEVTESYSHGG